MKQFKIRASAIGQIITNPKTKKAQEAGELSETAKTYCEIWLKEQLYKRKKEFTNKYVEKGTNSEEDSIEYLADIDKTIYFKNEEFFENDFMQGTPDIILNEKIIDIKSSWDAFTFPLFENEITNKIYWWQLQGYMILTERKKAELIYVLVNTPENLIEKEIYYTTKDNEFLSKEQYEEIEDNIRKNHNYDDTVSELRIKRFEIELNPDAEEQIKERVLQCRKYIEELITSIMG